MARTSLLRHLQSVFQDVAEAERRGVEPERIADERRQSTLAGRIGRREFLGGLSALAAAVALPRVVRAQSAPRIAVVGAGLAGLTAALRLRQAGYQATVYEASDRLGGRCWTRRGDFLEGQTAEHGGELIDQSHTEIRQLSQELGLPLDNLLAAEVNGTEPFYLFDGARYGYQQATDDVKAIWQRIKDDLTAASYPTLYSSYTPRGFQLDHLSIAEWIAQTVPGGLASPLGQLLDAAYVIEYGAEISDQSSLNLLYLLGYSGQGQLRVFGPSNEKSRVRGGNDQIVSRLAERLPGQIQTGTALTALARNPDGRFTLTFSRGSGTVTAVADRVVLALPFSILRSQVDLRRAGFNSIKQIAIANQGMGANAKLHLQFSTRRWNALGCNGETYADTGYQNTWEVTRAQAGTAGILNNYTGGNTALALGGVRPDRLARQFLGQIEPVLPGLGAAWNGRATLDWWPGQPWVKGAYSYWKVGQYTWFAGAEAERSGNCHFCGEHTSIDSQGYLNGAVETGERVAREILADYKAGLTP
jgi:monoamine oxidase